MAPCSTPDCIAFGHPGVWVASSSLTPPNRFFFGKRYLVSVLRLSGLEGFALLGLTVVRLSMASFAYAFYLLPDLKGSIRSNSRPPCYFSSIYIARFSRTNSVSNLVFDLFGIHKGGPASSFELLSIPRGS
jgi:hypothetical protein